jgi:hypothetical protein
VRLARDLHMLENRMGGLGNLNPSQTHHDRSDRISCGRKPRLEIGPLAHLPTRSPSRCAFRGHNPCLRVGSPHRRIVSAWLTSADTRSSLLATSYRQFGPILCFLYSKSPQNFTVPLGVTRNQAGKQQRGEHVSQTIIYYVGRDESS